MSLATRVSDLATRIGTEIKTIKTHYSGNNQGDLSLLDTTVKTSLLAAINEIVGVIDGLGFGDMLSTNNLSDVANAATALGNIGGLSQAEIDGRVQLIVDAAPAALDTLNELAAALGDDADFAATMTTALSGKEPVFTKNGAFNKNFGTAAGTVAEGNHTHAFSAITGKPSTLAGYGISDAAPASHTHAFSAITGKPTTLGGYGITDAALSNHNHSGTYVESETDPIFTAWNKSTGISITESQISDFGSYSVTGHVHTFASLTTKPTTLAGYGITDAALSNHNHSGTYEPANANIQSHISDVNKHIDWTGTNKDLNTSGSIRISHAGPAILTLEGNTTSSKSLIFSDGATLGNITFGSSSTNMTFNVGAKTPMILQSNGIVNLPDYGEGNLAGVKAYYSGWDVNGNFLEISSIPFSDVSGRPTTLAGYGITDAAASSHTHTFASLTAKPTTLGGYGITDAYSKTEIGTPETNFVTVFEAAIA
jgi:hypothetical protein